MSAEAVARKLTELAAGPAVRCGACGDLSPVMAVVCRGCAKQICAGCVLDDEQETLRCWMCLDWTSAGREVRRKTRVRR